MTPSTVQSRINAFNPIATRRSEEAGVRFSMKLMRASLEKHMLMMKRILAEYCD
jgi:hypothetical protein